MKGRCKTCKSWERNSPGWDIEKHGVCWSDKFHDSEDYWESDLPLDGAVVQGDIDHLSWIETGESFGCIHHTPLPDGETK